MRKKIGRRSTEDNIIDAIIYIIGALVLFLTIYPFYYILILSLNEGTDASLGGIYFFPRKFTLENYTFFFNDDKWIKAVIISVARTVIGTIFGTFITLIVSYGLSFENLKYRKFYMTVVFICMYFGGGIIPYYTLLKFLHLINSFWVYVIPGALNTFFVIVGISFFRGIHPSLRESAIIDGASEFQVFLRIICPISKPFVATMILFIGVGQWNSWYDSAFFIRDQDLRTMSYLLMEAMNKTNLSASAAQSGITISTTTSLSVQLAAMMVTVLPIIFIYPFLQKYFVSGIMIGSVKE